MKLYLSSYRIPTPEDLFELVGSRENVKTAIITNAKDDGRSEADKNQKITAVQAYLDQLGLITSLVDLREYQGADKVEQNLQPYSLLFIAGGNTFALRQHMRASGFDEALPRLLDKGVVYAGESAGALVVGPSLAGFESMDNAEGFSNDRGGLGLVDAIIVPHHDSQDPRYRGRWANIQKANPGSEVLPLKDNQALIVIDGESRVVEAM